jgi:NAD(P)-dependent dehydrogenase (short-subunit alcohol dehydrogenase family)
MWKKLAIIVVLLALSFPLLDRFSRFRGTFPLLHVVEPYGFTFEEIPVLTGKVFVVTGASSGLGKFTSKHLALNGGKVIMACRSLEKCNGAKWEINEECKRKGKECDLETNDLDLSSLQSVKDFAENFLKLHNRIDSLILNAGVMFGDYSLTKDGIETQFGTNHIGHFYLTKLLLPVVKKTIPSTIVSVASLAHWFSVPGGIYSTLEEINNPTNYDPIAYYGQSKLANILFIKELNRQLKESGNSDVLVNVVHPGAVKGNLTRHIAVGSDLFLMFNEQFQKYMYWDEDVSALTVLRPAVSPQIIKDKISGQYFVPIARYPLNAESELAQNATFAKEFWIFSERILEEKLKNLK